MSGITVVFNETFKSSTQTLVVRKNLLMVWNLWWNGFRNLGILNINTNEKKKKKKLKDSLLSYYFSHFINIMIKYHAIMILFQMTLKVISFERSLETKLEEIWKNWWCVSNHPNYSKIQLFHLYNVWYTQIKWIFE